VIHERGFGTRGEEGVGLLVKGGEDSAKTCNAGAGFEEALRDITSARKEIFTAADKGGVIKSEQVEKKPLADPTEKLRKLFFGNRSACGVEEGIPVTLSPDEGEMVAARALEPSCNPEVLHIVEKGIGRSGGYPVEEPGQGPKDGALARLIGAVDDVKGATLIGKVEFQIGETSERDAVKIEDSHRDVS
jgi:hypothetical protein